MFRFVGRYAGIFFGFTFAGWSVANLEKGDATIAVGIGALVVIATYLGWLIGDLGALIADELDEIKDRVGEINDQLAGRSP